MTEDTHEESCAGTTKRGVGVNGKFINSAYRATRISF